MRKSSPIDALISKTTQGLLAATVLQPQRWWYLSDLANHLGRRPSSLQDPLIALVAAGILRRRKDGNRVYFQADPACPFLGELQGIIAKTVGLIDILRDALLPLGSQITVAFVHGSVAKSLERASSDIDLIVIGSLGLSKLSPILEAVEERLGRPVNASIYSSQEFSKKIVAKNHFLHDVLEKEKLFVIGNTDDLARTARC
ncbi:MAG: nucleotidyltransferase domain-containing protein [Thermoguttaceae bacterium]|jgi:predicted nucleotidyltransferase